MAKQVTFSLEALQKLVDDGVKAALAARKADNHVAAKDARSERSIKNEVATAKAFKKAGFKDIQPHKNIMTFNRWIAAGFRVMEGQKGIRVKGMNLFHRDQVRALTLEEKQALNAQNAAAVAEHDAKTGSAAHL